MCQLTSKCKNESEIVVLHKRVGAMSERRVPACGECASRVAMGALMQHGETQYYKLESLR